MQQIFIPHARVWGLELWCSLHTARMSRVREVAHLHSHQSYSLYQTHVNCSQSQTNTQRSRTPDILTVSCVRWRKNTSSQHENLLKDISLPTGSFVCFKGDFTCIATHSHCAKQTEMFGSVCLHALWSRPANDMFLHVKPA